MAVAAASPSSSWLKEVEPIITSSEKAAFLALTTDEAREEYIGEFWKTKAITADEYYERLAHVDSVFGSGKLSSGPNTDRGRMYLTLGAPDRVTRIPSSRIFYPLEIWHYSGAEAVGIKYALQFVFFERNGLGDYRLYSPNVDTIRRLLNPQASTRGMFPVNDTVSEADIRNRLNVGPAEDEVIEAALGVARGIKGEANDEILAHATSPSEAIRGMLRTKVTSRLVAGREATSLKMFQSFSSNGTPAVDLLLETTAANSIGLRVSLAAGQVLEQTETGLSFGAAEPLRYQHRLFLLPGEYNADFILDGGTVRFPLKVESSGPSEILTGNTTEPGRRTPFSFGLLNVAPTSSGSLALIQLVRPAPVLWRLLRGATVVWKTTSSGVSVLPGGFVLQQVGEPELPAGDYVLMATVEGETKSTKVHRGGVENSPLLLSYNANLTEDAESSSLTRQWLARGDLTKARAAADRAYALRRTDRNAIDLARVITFQGDLDSPRTTLRAILNRDPRQFDALTLMGLIETRLQDYPAAADYFRRALAVQESEDVKNALADVLRRP
jgi:GWxTD domain-containing protein